MDYIKPWELYECPYSEVNCEGRITGYIPELGFGTWCKWKLSYDPISVMLRHKCPGARRAQCELNKWTCLCGQVNSGNRKHCRKCGAPRPPEWFCGCGELNTRGEEFCKKCGKPKGYIYPECPDCRRTILDGEGYTCAACGKKHLCRYCIRRPIEEYDARVEYVDESGKTAYLCAKCREEAEVKKYGACKICGKPAPTYQCVCGTKACDKHAAEIFRACGWKEKFAWCPTCDSWICKDCVDVEFHFLNRETYRCKKCGKKLMLCNPGDWPYIWLSYSIRKRFV